MKIILSEKITRIIKARKKLEILLNVKITNRGKEVKLEGDAGDEYVAEKVIDAINYGFPISAAIDIKEQDFLLEVINIKDYTHRSDFKNIRARLIGTKGKTLKVLSDLAEGYIELVGNEVAIIAPVQTIANMREAIVAIIKGAKQSNVYSHLEKTRSPQIDDLGLKQDSENDL